MWMIVISAFLWDALESVHQAQWRRKSCLHFLAKSYAYIVSVFPAILSSPERVWEDARLLKHFPSSETLFRLWLLVPLFFFIFLKTYQCASLSNQLYATQISNQSKQNQLKKKLYKHCLKKVLSRLGRLYSVLLLNYYERKAI